MSYTTIWNVPDRLWAQIATILPPDKPAGAVGRPAIPNRQALDGMLHVLRTGCQWKSLKKEWYGASSSLHDRYQAWVAAGLFAQIFTLMVLYYDQHKGIRWRWQCMDSKLVPAPLGGKHTGKNPTDRGKLGSKRHILTDARGVPLAVLISAANVHDKRCAIPLLDSLCVPRPETIYCIHHLCADKGYDYNDLRTALQERHYKVHIKHRGAGLEEVPVDQRHPARRWVVERTLSWQNDFRSLRTRWAKKPENWLALIQFASALVLWRMANET